MNSIAIMICGLPGVGKTFLSNKILESNKNFIWLNTDKIRDTLNLNPKDADQDTTLMIYTKMIDEGRKIISEGLSPILDATFFQSEFREFAIRTFGKHHKLTVLHLVCDKEVCLTRISERKGNYKGVTNSEVYHNLNDRFNQFSEHEYRQYKYYIRLCTSDQKTRVKFFSNTLNAEITKILRNCDVEL